MFKRYGSWLLLLSALALLGAITLEQPVAQRLSSPIVSSFAEDESHYIYDGDGVRLDVNRATQSELMELPAIGETLANRIIEYREANGPFASIDSLTLVSGIGEATLSEIAPYIAVSQ